ncbi:MAG: STAS/SEC14 domain-containing protein [Kofleriaceae bacterium]
MMTKISDLPPGVLGFEVSGRLRREDYQDVLAPALREAATQGAVRVVIVMPKYEGFTSGALWQDLKLGVENWHTWKRIALVTDIEWMIHGVDWFGWMTPGEVKHFSMAERAAAISWAAG